jgi:membrane-bound metal-dependent hydrolase YbcI (DUF457 family)
MFIGHFAVGFASKRLAPKASLGVLMAAPVLLDLLWPIFLLTGLEQVRIEPGNTAFTPLNFVSYPYTHSLAAACAWGALFGFLYWLFTRYTQGALVISIGVISHWVLDFITHRPDLPLYPGGPRVGLGLWNSVPGTLAVETVMFAIGVWLYASYTRAKDMAGRTVFLIFVIFQVLTYVGDAFGPPPPTIDFLISIAFAAWLFPLWAWWFDRHRVVDNDPRYIDL